MAATVTSVSEIAGKRLGATSKDYLISEPRLGTPLNVVAGENAFKIATGKYNLTLYLSQGILVVEKWTASLRGDVNRDGRVTIDDVTALIDYLLSGNGSAIDLAGADCDQSGAVTIDDVTSLIDYLLSGHW